MLMKLAHRISLGETNPAADAAVPGVFFGIIFMMILGACSVPVLSATTFFTSFSKDEH